MSITPRTSFARHLAIALALLIVGCWRNAHAGPGGNITVFADAGGTACSLFDSSSPFTVYVVHSNISEPVNGSRFRIVESASFGATFVSETVLFSPFVGSLRSGIDVLYGGCVTGSVVVGSISYQGHGTSQPCSYSRESCMAGRFYFSYDAELSVYLAGCRANREAICEPG